MEFLPLKTRTFMPPKDDLWKLIDDYVPALKEWDIFFITSKIVAIHQWLCIKVGTKNKKDLILQEAEKCILSDVVPWKDIYITIKNNTLIPSAGIDESNAHGHYILWPKNIQKITKEIWQYLRKKHKITKLWVIMTDSSTTPLRRWILGKSIWFYGFEPLRNYIGTKDIFGKKMEISTTNIPDSLSAMAVFLMGEGKEKTPLCILRWMQWIAFSNKDTYKKFIIPYKKDLYYPLLKAFDI